MDVESRQHGYTTGRLDLRPNCNSQLCGNGRIVHGALQSLSLHAGTLLHYHDIGSDGRGERRSARAFLRDTPATTAAKDDMQQP